MNEKKFQQRPMTFTRNTVLQRIDEVLSAEEGYSIVSCSQMLLIKRVPLSMLKDLSDNVSTFLTLDYVFFIVRKGHVNVVIDSVERTIIQGRVVFASIGTIARITGFSDDVDMTCIVVDADVMWFALRESMPIWMLALTNTMCVTVKKDACTILDGILNVMYDMISTGIHEKSCHALRGAVFTFVHIIDSSCQGNDANIHMGTRQQISIVSQFMRLIKYGCFEQHYIDYYAHELCISPQHLCNLVKDALGVSAKMCIDKTMALHMKKLMICDHLSAEDVSKKMHFNNISTANRFFKRIEGTTLKVYEKYIVHISV